MRITALINNFSLENLLLFIISAAAFLLSISCHEFAHGFAALKLGDPTAKNAGRLTLNPIKHFDVLAVLFFLVFGFGWAKGVPINSAYFKNQKKGIVITSLAGPMTNVLLVIISLIAVNVISGMYASAAFIYIYWFFQFMISINAMLAIFNLLPIPPLDGSKIFFSLLPERIYYRIMSFDRYMLIITLILVYSGVLNNLVNNGTNNLINVLAAFVGMFFKGGA